MKAVRYCTAAALLAIANGTAESQLPTPWQTGIGYFVGPYGSGAAGGGIYCVDLQYVLPYGYPWSAFLNPVSPHNATPSGYTNSWLGGSCQSPSQQGVLTSGAPNLPQSGNPYGSSPIYSNLLYSPPNPPGNSGPGPNVAAFHYLPQSPPPPPPPPRNPPTPPVLNPHVTPEPATWLLLGTGLLAIVAFVAVRTTRL